MEDRIAIHIEQYGREGRSHELYCFLHPPAGWSRDLDDVYHNEFMERYSIQNAARWQRIYSENYQSVIDALRLEGYSVSKYCDVVEAVQKAFTEYLCREHGFRMSETAGEFHIRRLPKNWDDLCQAKEPGKQTFREWEEAHSYKCSVVSHDSK